MVEFLSEPEARQGGSKKGEGTTGPLAGLPQSYGAPGVLAEAAHKTGRAKADFELREIGREEYDRLKELLLLSRTFDLDSNDVPDLRRASGNHPVMRMCFSRFPKRLGNPNLNCIWSSVSENF